MRSRTARRRRERDPAGQGQRADTGPQPACPAEHPLFPAYRRTPAARLLGHGRGPPVQDPPLHEHRGRRAALPLFAPPINPRALVAAAAAGLDLGGVLSDIDAPAPPYRFRTIIRQSGTVRPGPRARRGLLAALEKSDAEELARIRCGDAGKRCRRPIDDVRAAGRSTTRRSGRSTCSPRPSSA